MLNECFMAENRIIAVCTVTDMFTFEGYLTIALGYLYRRLRFDTESAPCRRVSVLALVFSSYWHRIEPSLPTGKVQAKAGTVYFPPSGVVWAAHRSGPNTS
jgi:hypothetical protein